MISTAKGVAVRRAGRDIELVGGTTIWGMRHEAAEPPRRLLPLYFKELEGE